VPFTVVGVLAAKGVNAAGQDEDDQVVVPVTTALRRVFNQTYLGNVYLQAAGAGQMDGVAQSVRALLRA